MIHFCHNVLYIRFVSGQHFTNTFHILLLHDLLPHSGTIHSHQPHLDDHMGRKQHEIPTREFISSPELHSANVLLFIQGDQWNSSLWAAWGNDTSTRGRGRVIGLCVRWTQVVTSYSEQSRCCPNAKPSLSHSTDLQSLSRVKSLSSFSAKPQSSSKENAKEGCRNRKAASNTMWNYDC